MFVNDKIVLVAGARPNFMKIAPILSVMKKEGMNFSLVHTGQHYDEKMSADFFVQLNIPAPEINLESGGGTQAEQTAMIMVKFEAYLMQNPCKIVLVVGDVTSTLACSIVAKKMNIKVAHVEGGIRSGDMTMPEEINRIVTDSISDYFFATTELACSNLRKEGKGEHQIFFVGNTMIDTLLKNINRFEVPSFYEVNGLRKNEFFVMTLHRPSNVDDKESFLKILEAVEKGANGLKIVFPVHPRTRKNMERFNISDKTKTLVLVDPQGYLQFNYLVKNSIGVITDSGGITEETTAMGVPCMTLRTTTERPETCIIGTNELVGTDPLAIEQNVRKMATKQWKKGAIPTLWDGNTSNRIVDHLKTLLAE